MRIPSNAWARKIAAPIKPITAVIVSNIANVPLRYCATRNGGDLAQSKRFPGTNTQSRSIEDLRNRRGSTCEPAPRICDFTPRRMTALRTLRSLAWAHHFLALVSPASGHRQSDRKAEIR